MRIIPKTNSDSQIESAADWLATGAVSGFPRSSDLSNLESLGDWLGETAARVERAVEADLARQRCVECWQPTPISAEQPSVSTYRELVRVDLEAVEHVQLLAFGRIESPFGTLWAAHTELGLCALQFVDSVDQAILKAQLLQRFRPSEVVDQVSPEVERAVMRALVGEVAGTPDKPIAVHLIGTEFQVLVWQALLALKRGEYVSYGQLAQRLGRSSSARAVGGAVGANPLALLVPCHRVIRSTGALGGYRWGLGRKQAILLWEAMKG